MNKIIAGKVFASSFSKVGDEWKEVPVNFYAELIDYPKTSSFRHGSTPDQWQHQAMIDTDVFCWAESATHPGVFMYGLYCPMCSQHGNKPYWWSSNHTILNEVTGMNTIHVNAGEYAVLESTVEIPDGYEWDRSWLAPKK